MESDESKKVVAFPPKGRGDAVDEEVGVRLADLRLAMSLSAEQLASEISTTLEQIARYERGEDPVPETALAKLAKFLRVPVRFLDDKLAGRGKSQLRRSLRPVDHWFIAYVYPHEVSYIALARRLTGHHETACDLVQDAYAVVLADDKWKSIKQPRAYIMRVVQNLGLNKLKRAILVPFQQLGRNETLDYADDAPDAFQTLSAREELMRLVDALSELPPQCRKIMIMRRLEGLPPREIAKKLGITASTVDTQLARGLVILCKYFTDREATVVRLEPKTFRGPDAH